MTDPRQTSMPVRLVICSVLFAILVGCDPGGDPLGCDNTAGEYFDFRETHRCVKPSSPQETIILSRYRRVCSLADTTSSTVEYRVELARYVMPSEYLDLVSRLPSAQVTSLSLEFNLGNKDYHHVGWAPLPPVDIADTASTTFQLARSRFEQNDNASISEWSRLSNDVEQQNYRIWTFHVRANPLAVRDWWTANTGVITDAQPLLMPTDYAGETFQPEVTP